MEMVLARRRGGHQSIEVKFPALSMLAVQWRPAAASMMTLRGERAGVAGATGSLRGRTAALRKARPAAVNVPLNVRAARKAPVAVVPHPVVRKWQASGGHVATELIADVSGLVQIDSKR
jgi:hypothetical protein